MGEFNSFWEWFTDNENVVNEVFDTVNEKAEKLFLNKPVNPTAAIQRVQKVIERSERAL